MNRVYCIIGNSSVPLVDKCKNNNNSETNKKSNLANDCQVSDIFRLIFEIRFRLIFEH